MFQVILKKQPKTSFSVIFKHTLKKNVLYNQYNQKKHLYLWGFFFVSNIFLYAHHPADETTLLFKLRFIFIHLIPTLVAWTCVPFSVGGNFLICTIMGFIVNINVLTLANYNVMYGYESYRNSGRYASSLSLLIWNMHTLLWTTFAVSQGKGVNNLLSEHLYCLHYAPYFS